MHFRSTAVTGRRPACMYMWVSRQRKRGLALGCFISCEPTYVYAAAQQLWEEFGCSRVPKQEPKGSRARHNTIHYLLLLLGKEVMTITVSESVPECGSASVDANYIIHS